MTEEEWREVVGFPDYEVSSLGRVKRIASGPWGAGRHLRTGNVSMSKKSVNIGLARCGKTHTCKIHRLVCEAFHGPPPSPQHVVAHWDGDFKHNTPANLRWATRQENERDKIRHGRTIRGERHHFAKLTEVSVRAIRADKRMQREIAQDYRISIAAVSQIISRSRWGHVA